MAGLEDRPACPHSADSSIPQSAGSSVALSLDPYFAKVTASNLSVSIQARIDGTLGTYRAFINYDQRQLTPTSCSVTCNLAWSADTVALSEINLSGWSGTATLASVVFDAVGGPGSNTLLRLTADQLTDVQELPVANCVSSGAHFYLNVFSNQAQDFATATSSPTPSPSPTQVPTPPPPSPEPCDFWLPASLGCDEPLSSANALWILYNIVRPYAGYPSCPIHGGK